MTRAVYLRLAWQTMRKNYRVYLPFCLGSMVMVMMIYSMSALSETANSGSYFGDGTMGLVLNFGIWVMLLFSIFFYLYLNGFLNKNRQQEYGLFSVLGLEKGHLMRILLYQTLMLAAASIGCGIAAGVIVNKLMFLLISCLVRNEVPLGFSFSMRSALYTIAWTAAEYGLIDAVSCWSIARSKPIDLVQGQDAGETEPKSKWPYTLTGLLCLAGGYGIALTVQDPIEAIFFFFAAVVLVIIGTYCLFISGSISLLKLLQSNPRYYYQTRHFLNISNMKYRMKKNAVSLANICILSTMILVAISTTASLYAGVDYLVNVSNPTEYSVSLYQADPADYPAVLDILQGIPQSLGTKGEPLVYLSEVFSTDGQVLHPSREVISAKGDETQFILAAPAYPGQFTGAELADNEIAVFTNKPGVFEEGAALQIGSDMYTIREVHSDTSGQIQSTQSALETSAPSDGSESSEASMEAPAGTQTELPVDKQESHPADPADMEADTQPDPSSDPAVQLQALQIPMAAYLGTVVVMPNPQTLTTLSDQLVVSSLFEQGDLDLDYDRFAEVVETTFHETGLVFQYSSRTFERDNIQALYASLIFIGLFISLLILTIIILIMYYKQISEGYEDKRRYAILQNVGLEPREIKRIINQQALWMFFLPLAAALVHILAAFPVIRLILSALVGMQTQLFIIVTFTCAGIFALIYLIIYRLTARIYYSIITQA